MNLDKAFQADLPNAKLVDELNMKVKEKTGRAIYSFATKYFSHHKPDIYPIYDSYVDKLLRFYRDMKKNEMKTPFKFQDKEWNESVDEEFSNFEIFKKAFANHCNLLCFSHLCNKS